METLPQLTKADILRWAGEDSFTYARRYICKDDFQRPRRQGDTLKAQCQGSRPQPYDVEVTLGPEGIVTGCCTCDAGTGGGCKHVAALLLTWLTDPSSFIEVEDLATALGRRHKDDLIALIVQMVARHPDLDTLLRSSQTPASELPPPLAADLVRQQAEYAFSKCQYEWTAASAIAHDLQPLLAEGKSYLQAASWSEAAVVFSALADVTLSHYRYLRDNSGHLGEVINTCVVHLGQCLANLQTPEIRQTVLRTLFDAFRLNVEMNGAGAGYTASTVILAQACDCERQLVVEWAQAALPASQTLSSGAQRAALGGLMLALQPTDVDNATYLAICRQAGRLDHLLERLLNQGCLDEAAAELAQVGDAEMPALADVFIAYGQSDLAERLVAERAQTSPDPRLIEWLKKIASQRGDLAAALSLAETLFWRHPTVAGYEEIRHVAEQIEGSEQKAASAHYTIWLSRREEILARLVREGKPELVTEIHLAEQNIDAALESLKLAPNGNAFHKGEPLAVRVAEAAESDHPFAAIDLYLKAVERLVSSRERANYTTASKYLVRVRRLYYSLGELLGWEMLLNTLQQNSTLAEEMERQGITN